MQDLQHPECRDWVCLQLLLLHAWLRWDGLDPVAMLVSKMSLLFPVLLLDDG